MLDPDRVELTLFGIFVRALAEERLPATGLLAELVGVDGRRNKLFEIAEHLAESAGADGAGQVGRLVANIERHRLQVINELLAPDLRIARFAAFEQHHDRRAFETSCHIARVHAFAHRFRKLRQDFFGFDDADLVVNLAEVIRLDVNETVGARLRLALQSLGKALEELRAVVEQHRRVALQRVMHELGRFLGDLELRRDANLNARAVVKVDLAELEVQLFSVTRVDMCFDDQLLVFLPFAGDRCDERTLQCGLALGFEVVHHRHADKVVLVLDLELLEPGVVDVHEDAFLDERIRARRGGHVVLELAFVFGGGLQRRVQCAFHAQGA